jgi:hypothetical protein
VQALVISKQLESQMDSRPWGSGVIVDSLEMEENQKDFGESREIGDA